MYHESEMMTRPWRAVNRLEELFGDSASMIFQSPFIFRAGVTRSSFIMEVSFQIYSLLLLSISCCSVLFYSSSFYVCRHVKLVRSLQNKKS